MVEIDVDFGFVIIVKYYVYIVLCGFVDDFVDFVMCY